MDSDEAQFLFLNRASHYAFMIPYSFIDDGTISHSWSDTVRVPGKKLQLQFDSFSVY